MRKASTHFLKFLLTIFNYLQRLSSANSARKTFYLLSLLSYKNLSRVRDDVDEIGTQMELTISRNAVTQTDPVIIKSCSKSIQCKLFWGKHKSLQTVHYYKDVTTMTEQTFADCNFI